MYLCLSVYEKSAHKLNTNVLMNLESCLVLRTWDVAVMQSIVAKSSFVFTGAKLQVFSRQEDLHVLDFFGPDFVSLYSSLSFQLTWMG